MYVCTAELLGTPAHSAVRSSPTGVFRQCDTYLPTNQAPYRMCSLRVLDVRVLRACARAACARPHGSFTIAHLGGRLLRAYQPPTHPANCFKIPMAIHACGLRVRPIAAPAPR